MQPALQELLTQSPQLYVQQRKEWTEILINFETVNKYVIMDQNQSTLGAIVERGGGFGTVLKRWFLRSHRGFEIDVLSKVGEALIHLSRPFFFFFSDLEVRSPEGEKYGSIHRRFGILHKIYDLRDENGQVFARIESPIWRLWTFPLVGTQAKIAKRWGGALREVFTDADTYQVDFANQPWSLPQRAVILGAAVSIDFDFFENNQGNSSLLSWLPGWD